MEANRTTIRKINKMSLFNKSKVLFSFKDIIEVIRMIK